MYRRFATWHYCSQLQILLEAAMATEVSMSARAPAVVDFVHFYAAVRHSRSQNIALSTIMPRGESSGTHAHNGNK